MNARLTEAAKADLVIWPATAALAAVLGLGAAYLVWSHLPQAVSLEIFRWGLIAGTAGFALIAFGLKNSLARLFIIGFAATFVVSTALATHAFTIFS
ncbi:MAG: hypothetical protein M3Y21_08175 [Candidatus Eremiobacteraeota bacterium]|nr:hypothetical protein [Candidatus Eremiobacteraeota bacterium]